MSRTSSVKGTTASSRTSWWWWGGNSAVEAALDLYRCGARATIVHFGPTWDKNIKPWILPDVTNRIAEGAIGVRWNARVREIRTRVVVLDVEGQGERLSASLVYLMTGYTPHGTLLGQLGVRVDSLTGVPAHDPLTMETPVPGVFIAGVLASGYDANKIFIENGRDHGALIAKALGQEREIRAVSCDRQSSRRAEAPPSVREVRIQSPILPTSGSRVLALSVLLRGGTDGLPSP